MICYLNPSHTLAADTTETSYCLTKDKNNCYDWEADTASNEIIWIEKVSVIG